MNRMQELAQRRQELVERSTAQRAALLAAAEPIARKAAAVDRAVAYVRQYPVLAALAVVAVGLIGPRKLFELGARAIALYALLRR
ncbi:MAG TPA: YqjK family protein [Burkholderiales bacterium]|nr:YqjK family protein [Burkholderiales bacterium]